MKRFSSPWQEAVAAFHRKFGQPVGEWPRPLPFERLALRIGLHFEEAIKEMLEALLSRDPVKTADAIGDGVVVLLGTAVECGIDMAEVMEAIFASNMTKEGGGMREDGKILKPVGWKPPAIREILLSQGWRP